MATEQNLLKNLKQLEIDIKNFLKDRIRRECPHVPVEENLSFEDFKSKYVEKNRPVILRRMVDNWPAVKKWDLDFFANIYGNVEVEVNLYDAKNVKKSNISSLIQEIKQCDGSYPVYLQEWWFQTICPDLFSDIAIPEYFADDLNIKLLGYYNSTLWIGAKNASTPIHQDAVFTNIWTVQLYGKKEWILFDKNAYLKSKENGEADYDEFLSNPANNVMSCDLVKGDILYVPYKWWHRAQTLEDAISLNSFYITDEIIKRYLKDIIAIPMAMVLNKDLIQKNDPRRYNICKARIDILSELLGYNKDNILGIKPTQY